MITFSANPATQTTPASKPRPVTGTKPVEKPIADIEDFQSVDRLCLSCPSKGDQALPLNDQSAKKHKGIVLKPRQQKV